MDNTRLLLFIALSFIGLLLWNAWQRDHAPVPPPASQAIPPAVSAPALDTELPRPPAAATQPSTPAVGVPAVPAVTGASTTGGETVRILTDVLELDVTLDGAGITRAALPTFPVSLETPDVPFQLMGNDERMFFIEQGGLTGDATGPDHRARYTVSAYSFQLVPEADVLQVPFTWSDSNGLRVTKTLTLRRGSYAIEVRYDVLNNTGEPWRGRLYDQLQRRYEEPGHRLLYTYTGPALSTPEKRYNKIDYDDLQDTPIDVTTKNGWVAILQHYFVAALLPPDSIEHTFYSKVLDSDRYLVGFYGPALEVPPGASTSAQVTVYVGPKLQHVLAKTAPGLDLTVDFGKLWFIAKPLYSILETIHRLTGNWGWSIVLVTFLIKLIFYPLSAAGYRSMAKMRRVQPRMVALKERYNNDRARLNQAMMDLYKEEKINPLGGCFPILIQIPVFISLYWVLLETVELRQAPFILWIDNLSSKDPYFVLPLLMGISMWIQQKLNPAPVDPVQEKVMQVLPFVFTIFFAFFPSGLVLYWVVNNVLSIAQQWNITRTIEQHGKT